MTKRRKNKRRPSPVLVSLPPEKLEAILEKTKSVLNEEEQDMLRGTVDTLSFLTRQLRKAKVSLQRLRQMLFGPKTESSANLGNRENDDGTQQEPSSDPDKPGKPKPKPKGHGRNGADDYPGARKVVILHQGLVPGQHCPDCSRGKLFELHTPAKLIRIESMPPLVATRYECQRLRCSACGKVYTAQAPGDVALKKYDESAVVMIIVLKYDTGVPFFRLERLQDSLGVPMPAATAWHLVADAAVILLPLHARIVHLAAQGRLLHNDDTTTTILSHMDPFYTAEDQSGKPRTGTFTTGVISMVGERKIALFFTGRKHSGENLADLLAQRDGELDPPIQMCDLLAANTAGDFETIVAGCNAHARRRYVQVRENFPDECEWVLDCFKDVYRNDAVARKQAMDDHQRLAYHQDHSEPVMNQLLAWGQDQLKEKIVEPNSGLGEAIVFMEKHWDRLTLFLRVPGAPLDNNIVERLLKRPILHRKNSMFFKTDHGARVADVFMSIINTANLAGVNPFDYLVTLLRNADRVKDDPDRWLPWNYRDTVAAGNGSGAGPPD